MSKVRSLVILSGGQDSSTVLGNLAQWSNNEVEAITFDYGQKNCVEIEAAKNIAGHFGVRHHVIDMKSFGKVATNSTMTNGSLKAGRDNYPGTSLPDSFVPARNVVFLTIAYAYAISNNFDEIYIGVNQQDYSGYPDCRSETIEAVKKALQLATDRDIKIVTPLLNHSKCDIFETARNGGFLDVILENTVTCYNGELVINDWGRGCGECPACVLRKKGYYQMRFKEEKEG